MVLQDLLDDGQAQPGSLGLVGDIGLGQPGPVLLRQADPVIADADPHRVRAAAPDGRAHSEQNPARTRTHRHGIGGVLQQVGQCLDQHPPVAGGDGALRGNIRAPGDLRPGGLLQHQRLARDAADILRLDHRLGHAGEGGELIHHAAYIADAAHDGVGALDEGVGIRGDFLGETPLQPLGGKLDRGQRVLDLVRDAPRHVRPGGLALGRLQFGDVVEGHHEAVRAPAGQVGADAHQQGAPAAGRADLDFRGAGALGRGLRLAHQLGEFRHHAAKLAPDGRQQIGFQQLTGGMVRQFDPPARIQADDAGGDAGQHRFGEPAAFVDLAVGVHQLRPLGGELAGHAIEGTRQAGDLVLRPRLRHPHLQVAAAHTFGGMDQPADRAGDLIGHHQPDQHRGRQHQQGDDGEDPGKRYLQPGSIFIQAVVSGDRLLRLLHVGQDLRIDRPADHQHQRRRGFQLHDGANPRAIVGVQHRHVAGPRPFRGPGRRRFGAHALEHAGGGHDLSGDRLEDHRLGQAAQRGLRRQQFREGGRIGAQKGAGAGDVVAHFQRDRADVVAVLLQIAA